jgi:hypothetical protein
MAPLLLKLLALVWFAVSIPRRRRIGGLTLTAPQPEIRC